jgi:uncharacterized protein (DUF952 family)
MSRLIYKICPKSQWQEAERQGVFTGAPVDLADGFIHFSTATQVEETAAKHFAGQAVLVLLAFEEVKLWGELLYVRGRGGQLFPHLYGPLALSGVHWVKPLPLDAEARHLFPALEP